MRAFLAVSCCVFAVACADDDRLIRVSDAAAIEPSRVDFGDVFVGASYTRTVTVRNAGRSRLLLQASRVPERFSIEPSTLRLEAGASEEVQVRFSPDRLGAAEGPLVFMAESGATAVAGLEGRGIHPAVEFPEVVDFGDVLVGESASRVVTFANHERRYVETAIEGIGEPFAADPLEFRILAGGTAGVTFSFQPSEKGRQVASVDVRACDECPPRPLTLVGAGVVAGEMGLSVRPLVCDFGTGWIGGSSTCEVSMENTGDLLIELSKPVAPQGFEIDAELVPSLLPPGASARFWVVFRPRAAGTFVADLPIPNARGAPLANVMLKAIGKEPLAVTPSPIAFGPQPLRYPGRKTVLLTSPGGLPIVLGDISLGGAGAHAYRLLRVPLPGVVVQEKPIPIRIEFEAEEEGDFPATLRIETDGPPSEIPISGSGLVTTCDPPPRVLGTTPFRFGEVGSTPVDEETIRVVNLTGTSCFVWDFRYDELDAYPPGRQPAFTLDAPEGMTLLEPLGWLDVKVTFWRDQDPCKPGACQVGFPAISFHHSRYERSRVRVPIDAPPAERLIRKEPASTVDFGPLRVGATATRTLRIRAGTPTPDTFVRTIGLVGPDLSDFHLDRTFEEELRPVVVDEDGLEIPVVFAPRSVGPKAATVSIAVGGAAPILFHLLGEGASR